jgi:hypothetical protein
MGQQGQPRRSRRSAGPSSPPSDSDRVRSIYDGLRDAALVLDDVHDQADEGPAQEAAWRARCDVRDALVSTYRLMQRLDVRARVELVPYMRG